MPTLKTYTAPLQSPETSFQKATPASMGADIGEGLTAVGRGAHELYQQMSENEARTALVGAAQIRAKYAQALDEATASGADTAPLKEKMTDELAKIGENFSTRHGVQSLQLHSAQSVMMFDEQANRIAVTRASEQARVQGQQFLQDQSAVLRSNPSALSIAERNVDDFVATFNRMPPDKKALVAQDLKTQLNMAAVQASARIDPEGTKQRLIDGEWKLTPREREQGIAEADTQMRAIRSDQIHQRQLADYDEKKRWAEDSNDLLTKIYKGLIKPGEIADSTLPREIRENLSHFQEWLMNDRLNRLNKPHPLEMLRLWNMIHANDDDPNKVYDNTEVLKSAKAGNLNALEAERASGWVANQKDENNRTIGSRLANQMNIVGRALSQDPSFIAQPATVAEIQLDYQDRVLKKVNEMRTAKENPAQIFEAGNKNFVGSREFIQQSIDNVRSSSRRLNEAVAAPVKFPDGVTRKWNGQEPKTDIKNWTPVSAAAIMPTTGVTASGIPY